jgi:hypothetical protein
VGVDRGVVKPMGVQTSAGGLSLRVGAALVVATGVVGSTLIGIAMSLYPGGTELDPHCVGHSFWFNLLCDLTNARALNGASNAAGSSFARAGMAVLGLGFGAFWLILPAAFPGHRALAATVRLAGAVSVLGFLSVPFAAGRWHAVAVFAAAGPGVLAALVGAAATFRYVKDKILLTAAFGAIASATIDSLLYAQRVRDEFRSCPPAMPVFQRLLALFVLAWAGATAWRVLRPPRARRDPDGGGASIH